MLFSSMIFLWVFLPMILILYFFIDNKYRNGLLLIASLIFYAWGEPRYILLMISSILINYFFALMINKEQDLRKNKRRLIVCLVINLATLVYFKYFNFIIGNINNIISSKITVRDIALPIGISFYTFQAMSYVVDIYRNKKENGNITVQKNILDLALYIAFFPQLIAGPIVKYHEIAIQLKERYIDSKVVAYGIKRFTYGLGKKVLVSNTLAVVADEIFNLTKNDLNMPIAWLGIICYSIQIYFDFSGYSDMAIGLGKIFGFDFMENFNYPYISQSIQEFWHRWHISLSTWFKEYLYIPLGGNRKGNIRTYCNLMIVFLATGIWHGASWNFILWGIYYGVLLILEKIVLGDILKKNRFKSINHIYSVFMIMIGWVIFRAETLEKAVTYIRIMFSPKLQQGTYTVEYFINVEVFIVLVIGILCSGIVQGVFPKLKEVLYSKEKISIYEIIILPIILITCIVQLVSGAYNPFIYFRF